MRRGREPHKHNFIPDLELGENDDGSAKWWVCECGKKQQFVPYPPIDIGAAHLIADIRGDGLRSTRR